MHIKICENRDFPGCPVVRISPSNAGGAGPIPGEELRFPRALQLKNQNLKQKQYCNKFNKDLTNNLHKNNLKYMSIEPHQGLLLSNLSIGNKQRP